MTKTPAGWRWIEKPRSLWQDYLEALNEAENIVNHGGSTQAAYSSGVCKLCHWYTACLKQLSAAHDLTLVPELGRSKRDVMSVAPMRSRRCSIRQWQ